MSKTADHYTEMEEMYKKGYRYYCIPQSPAVSPYIGLYAKTLQMVAQIHRDWPTQMFTVVDIEKQLTQMVEDAYDRAYAKQNW